MKICANCNSEGMAHYSLDKLEEGIVKDAAPSALWVCLDPNCLLSYTEGQYSALPDGPFNPHPLEEFKS